MASKRKGKQKGPQQHAEGQHGPKAHRAFIEQLHSTPAQPPEQEEAQHDTPGKHRLFERREQHDPANKNSEKYRLDKDIRDHGHVRENFQVQGGADSHPAMPRSQINPGNPDEPNRSDGLRPDEIPDRIQGGS